MKPYIFLFTGLSLIITACSSHSSDQKTEEASTVDTNIVPATQQFCYKYIKNKDTATITMMSSGPITTGELNYHLYEKDQNKGIFEGELYGDTLIAEYTFNSEGKESVRQVAFLKKGDQLLEGYGDTEEKKGKTMFKDRKSLKFGQGIVFSKGDCY